REGGAVPALGGQRRAGGALPHGGTRRRQGDAREGGAAAGRDWWRGSSGGGLEPLRRRAPGDGAAPRVARDLMPNRAPANNSNRRGLRPAAESEGKKHEQRRHEWSGRDPRRRRDPGRGG